MVEIQIKYGNSEIPYEIRDKNLWEIVKTRNEPVGFKSISTAQKEIEKGIQNPIGSPKLERIIEANCNVVVTHDDHTRGTPGYIILPPLLNILNECGVPDENINLIFACGTHRAVRPEEVKSIVGEEVLNRITCMSHDCDANDLIKVGTTSRNNEIKINALAAQADHIVATGKCEYHYYAGFSGGRKSILPGISSREAINKNHSYLIDDKAVTGKLMENPVHEDMIEAVKMTKTDFMVNVVQNTKKNLLRVFAGDLITAHLEATKFCDSLYRVQVKGLADIVLVAAGYPKDIDLYQAYKAIDNAQMIVKPGGVIVAVLECREGHGHPVFYEWAKRYRTLGELEINIKANFEMGGHKAYYLAKVQEKAKIILVSKMNPKEIKELFMLEPAKSVEDAMELAYSWTGRDARVTFMPDGPITLPAL